MEEECVKYEVYAPENADLSTLCGNLNNFAKEGSRGYIWDSEDFKLNVGSSPKTGPVLFGHQKLGDNIEDEWFVVNLLLKISVKHPDLVIHVHDADGEFLLIQAADVIPEWLEPENSENRIFICRGKICVISQDHFPDSPSIKEAVNFVRADPFRSFASVDVQDAICSKLLIFHDDLSSLTHKTFALLPVNIAAILKHDPNLVSSAINAFFKRKDGSAYSLSDTTVLNISGPKVKTLVTFSKAQYAKLSFSQLNAPKGMIFPAPDNPEYLSCTLGVKLTIGFDQLLNDQDFKEKIKNLLEGLDLSNLESHTIIGQEDDTKWLDIDPNELDDEFSSAQKTFGMSEKEIGELMETWDKEFDNPELVKDKNSLKSCVDGLKGFMEKMSLYEGVDVSPELDDEESDSSEDGSVESPDIGSEEDEDFLELEILETLKHDPDLLMRIIELNANEGISNVQLMERISKLPSTSAKSDTKKKGLADIDPIKLEEAKVKPQRKLADVVESEINERKEENGESSGDEDDDVEELDRLDDGEMNVGEFSSDDEEYGDFAEHTPTINEIYQKESRKAVFVEDPNLSDPETSQNDNCDRQMTMKEYYDQMDAELAGSMKLDDIAAMRAGDDADRSCHLAKSIVDVKVAQAETGLSGTGPSSTIFASLREKK